MKKAGYRWGESHPQRILSMKDVLNIRREYDRGGATYRGLAKKYGVGGSTIGDILNNKTWRKLTTKNF